MGALQSDEQRKNTVGIQMTPRSLAEVVTDSATEEGPTPAAFALPANITIQTRAQEIVQDSSLNPDTPVSPVTPYEAEGGVTGLDTSTLRSMPRLSTLRMGAEGAEIYPDPSGGGTANEQLSQRVN